MNRQQNRWMLIPVFGTVLFVALYILATFFYPGGSQLDSNAIGFSWANNYWCNLLDEHAINGQYNPAKPIAITGMVVLCLTLSFFWFLFPLYIDIGTFAKRAMQISGTLAMGIALFLFSSIDHDIVINLASAFGLIAMAGTFIALYKSKWHGLMAFGLLNLILIALNNYVYYNKELILYLPLIQKISFAAFLGWISGIAMRLYRTKDMK